MKTNLNTKLVSAFCAAAALSGTVQAQADLVRELSPILVTATRIELDDTVTPFAAEVYTRDDIKASGATNTYDFLESFTGLQITPSSGNKAAPNIDARGFGQQFGYENLVVSVDGRRLNNIDMSNPFIASIPLNSIERIEVTLGSGAILFGDGATAGVLNIVTQPSNSAGIDLHVGSNGQNGVSATAGKVEENSHIGFHVTRNNVGSFSARDNVGNSDSSEQGNWGVTVGWEADSKIKLDLSLGHSEQDVFYPGYLSQAQWLSNPAQTPDTGAADYGFSHQKLASDIWGVKITAPVTPAATLKATFNSEDKTSTFVAPYAYGFEYSVREAEFSVTHEDSNVKSVAGLQFRNADRTSAGSNITSKDSQSVFLQRTHFDGDYTWMYGARNDRVKLNYTALDGSNTLNQVANLNSVEAGVNKAINEELSLFGNYTHAGRSPDVDMFFSYDSDNHKQVFNGNISPMASDTVTFGLTHLNDQRKLKANVFYSKINDEIFYHPTAYVNTNYSKTRKYGLEIQDREKFSASLEGWLNYGYTVAVIDNDSRSTQTGTLNGTFLPGVSKNVISAGLRWQYKPSTLISVTHTWRDRAYALNDVTNTAAQQQQIYQSTDLMLSHRFSTKIQGYVAVKNLLDRANGAWVDVDQIYPYNFTRNWIIGLKVAL
jgi:iron complex outermembrane receptor protein